MDDQIQLIRRQIEETEAQIRELKIQLQKAEQETEARQTTRDDGNRFSTQQNGETTNIPYQNAATISGSELEGNDSSSIRTAHQSAWPLHDAEYKRYGRQLIMPTIGLDGQLRLKNAKVLIVGVGGLGCPAAAYLAGAGIGSLGLMDGDLVELSNLHRQIAHSTNKIGMSKVDSAFEYLNSLNPQVHYHRYHCHLSPEKAISIFDSYDIILDCTDHPTSRYLISDACILTGKTLVSASALKTEGQLIVLNNPPQPVGDLSGGPCYRCIFPKPPPAESVLSCGEGGILGPVVGVMGVLQALEAVKLLTANTTHLKSDTFVANGHSEERPKPCMLMFSAYSDPQFRTVRLRSRRKNCSVCSTDATITKQSLTSGSLDYVAFCGALAPVNLLPAQQRIAASDFAQLSETDAKTLIDVRDEIQFGICALPGSLNIPWTGNSTSWLDNAKQRGVLEDNNDAKYVVCRFGNDSQLVAKAMMESNENMQVKDIKGGFKSWREEVDAQWPDY